MAEIWHRTLFLFGLYNLQLIIIVNIIIIVSVIVSVSGKCSSALSHGAYCSYLIITISIYSTKPKELNLL